MHKLRFSTGHSIQELDLDDEYVLIIEDPDLNLTVIDINLGDKLAGLAEPYVALLLRVCAEVLPTTDYHHRRSVMSQLVNASLDALKRQVFNRWEEENAGPQKEGGEL
jgi:hypothetical protein